MHHGHYGFNQRTSLLELAKLSDPNSAAWQERAIDACAKLGEALDDDYPLWAEMTWPGDSIDRISWKEVAETAEATLKYSDKIKQELECSCNGITGLCRVCQAYARLKGGSNDSN